MKARKDKIRKAIFQLYYSKVIIKPIIYKAVAGSYIYMMSSMHTRQRETLSYQPLTLFRLGGAGRNLPTLILNGISITVTAMTLIFHDFS